MKSIIFTLALMLPMAINAQRVRYVYNDDVYQAREYAGMYDEVINENTTVKNVMVNHNQEINYYHKNNVVVRHINLDGYQSTYGYERIYEPYYRRQYVEYYPKYDTYDEYVYDYGNRWQLFFKHYSSALINTDALNQLIRYALSNPHLDFYIEAYSDNDVRNKKLSNSRLNFIFNKLYDNGINTNRLHVMNYLCSKQEYRINKYNNYITVTASYIK